MPKSFQPRAGARPKGTASKQAVLPREIEEEVRRTARPAQEADVLSRLSRAIELLERDDPRGALPEAEKAKLMAPRSASVREVLGMAFYGLGMWADALTELKAYKRITGRVDQNHLIADCLRGLGRPEETVPLADEILRDRSMLGHCGKCLHGGRWLRRSGAEKSMECSHRQSYPTLKNIATSNRVKSAAIVRGC